MARSYEITTKCRSNVVVVGFGSIESHKGYLPYGVDTVITGRIIEKCVSRYSESRDTCILLYPVLPYGYSHEWLRERGTISIEPSIYSKLVESIVSSIEENLEVNGYIFINGHGGNYSILHSLSKKLYSIYRKPFILIDVWRLASSYGLKYCHACVFEAQLYNYLTGSSDQGSDQEFCRENGLYGYYREYDAGYCGSTDIDVVDFIDNLCSLFDKAVEVICG